MTTNSDWQDAACLSKAYRDPVANDKAFFPGNGQPPKKRPHESYCGGCTIKEFCLVNGVFYNEWGVWGGLSRTERRALPQAAKDYLLDLAQRVYHLQPRPTVDEILRLHKRHVDPLPIEPTLEDELVPPEEEIFLIQFVLPDVPQFVLPTQDKSESSEQSVQTVVPRWEESVAVFVLPLSIPRFYIDPMKDPNRRSAS